MWCRRRPRQKVISSEKGNSDCNGGQCAHGGRHGRLSGGSFIDDYSTDEEKLSEAKASLDSLLQNAEGLSAEEIQDRIEGIFQK